MDLSTAGGLSIMFVCGFTSVFSVFRTYKGLGKTRS